MIFPLIISAIFHLATFSVLKGQGNKNKTNSNKNSEQVEHSEGNSKEVKIRVYMKQSKLVEKGKSNKPSINSEDTGTKDCKNYYFGIGIILQLVSDANNYCEISYVSPKGPADLAGIKKGDKIKNTSGMDCMLRGEENSHVTFYLNKNGQEQTITLNRKKICQD